jgi:hypothetical protein
VFGLRSLSLTHRNHLMRTLDLKRRKVMLSLNIFEPLLRGCNNLFELFLFIGLQPFPF